MKILFEYAVVIIVAGLVYLLNKKVGITVFVAKKTSRIVYNAILVLFILFPFIVWEIFNVENNIIQHVLYGISIGGITLTGNYEKNKKR